MFVRGRNKKKEMTFTLYRALAIGIVAGSRATFPFLLLNVFLGKFCFFSSGIWPFISLSAPGEPARRRRPVAVSLVPAPGGPAGRHSGAPGCIPPPSSGEWGMEALAQPAELAVSELVTNAVLDSPPTHGRPGRRRGAPTGLPVVAGLKEVQTAMKLVRPVSDEDAQQLQLDGETPVEVKRPGSYYPQYHSMEELSLPESKIAKAFYEAAAEAACMSVERLVKAVWQAEAKMDAWKSEKKRAERFGKRMHPKTRTGTKIRR